MHSVHYINMDVRTNNAAISINGTLNRSLYCEICFDETIGDIWPKHVHMQLYQKINENRTVEQYLTHNKARMS